MPPTTQRPYTVAAETLARDEKRAALRARDFGAVFRLMKKWDGASQDRIASPVEGLTQSRVSRIMRGEDRIMSLELIERIADAHHIPGALLGLAPRPWESPATAPAARTEPATPAASAASAPAGEIVERSLQIDIEVDPDGWATLTYRHELHNGGPDPLTRIARELWFEETNGPLTIEPVAYDERNVIIQRVHDTPLNARFACQIFPAVQHGESTTIGYRATGGRFVYDHYWRQSITRPTDEFLIRLRHHGISMLTRCTASEERPDGSEISATDGLSWQRDGDDIVIELARRHLRANQSVTLRWDTHRDPS